MTAAIRKLPANFVETELDGEGVLMSLASGEFFALRGTSLAIWKAIDGARTAQDIAGVLAAGYAENPDVIAQDIGPFLASLKDAGFIA